MAIIKTLKTTTNDTEQSVYPKTVLEAVVDSETNETLDVILDNIKSDTPNGSAYVDFNEQSGEVTGEVEAVTSAKLVSYSNTESGIEATNVQDAIDTVSSISKGKNRAKVFNTTEDMNNWLSNEENKGIANVGDNLYIVALDVPDWWISEVLEEADADTGFYYKIAQLETQKVDLTTITEGISNLENDYISKTNFNNTMNYDYICHTQNTPSDDNSYYWKFARITLTDTYSNTPIRFNIAQRGALGSLRFTSTASPSIESYEVSEFNQEGIISSCYVIPLGNGVFELYIEANNWQLTTITSLEMGVHTRHRVNLEWLDELVTVLPEGSIKAINNDEPDTFVLGEESDSFITFQRMGRLVTAHLINMLTESYNDLTGAIPDRFLPSFIVTTMGLTFSSDSNTRHCNIDLHPDGTLHSYILDDATHSRTLNTDMGAYGTLVYFAKN